MFVRVAFGVVALVGLGIGAGCASWTGQHEDSVLPDHRSESTTVEVENNNWADITVYLLRDNSRFRLGTVTSMDTRHFTVPDAAVAEGASIRLLADPVGSRFTHTTRPIQVSRGQAIEWQLENNLNLSSVSVW